MSDILLAPFSNSDIRDWPPEHFAALIGCLLASGPLPGRIKLVGTAGQRLRADDIVRRYDAARVTNTCGRLSWPEVLEEVRRAACVVGNNSGVAHLAGAYGVPTVCVFGGSHSRLEWRPRGERLLLLTRAVACSPCHIDHEGGCPYDKACLRRIEPAEVAAAVLDRLALAAPAPASTNGRMEGRCSAT